MEAITQISHSLLKRYIDHATQTTNDSKAEGCSEAESEESPSQMETDVSQSSSPCYARAKATPEAVALLGYDYNMYAVTSRP